MTITVRFLRLLGTLLVGGALLLPVFGCGKEQPVERVELPATPVLTLRSSWAVVRSPFLRVRQEPLARAEILAHLRRGSVMEILSKTERRETIDGVADYWYQINYEGLRGWVFGSFVQVMDSRTKADDYARDLR